MFNSAIIDVAIGMILSFLAVSLAASAVTEAISSVRKWREKTLAEGIQALLNYNENDPNRKLALDLYKHALINPLASGVAEKFEKLDHTPAYIDSRQFALAFYNTLGGESPSAVIAKIKDEQLKATMQALWDASSKDVEKFKNNIAVWFDNSMDRLSGWYKRKTQLWSFFVAFVIAALFNVNVLYEGAQIWTHPAAIAELATLHFDEPSDASRPEDYAKMASKFYNTLQPAYLVGWVDGPMPKLWDWQSCLIAGSSWVIVAGSALFGASFWFDILKRLTQLRGTGLKPERSDKRPQPDANQPS